MQQIGKWAAGIVGGVLALAVLFYAANATSAGTYNSALFLFVVLVLFVFAQIKRGFDQAYQSRHYGSETNAPAASGAGGGSSAKGGSQAKRGGQPAAAASAQGGQSQSAQSQSTKSQNAKTQSGKSQSTKAQAAKTESGSKSDSAAKNGGGKQGGGAQSAASSGKAGLSETAPSGPTNGSGAKP